ncbi:hypothetical protein [Mucilaginibacter phyllosphaerae]|uniref:Adenylosuccinate lyase n=1 Tax=Mucilaginibacter phyllosphaerae TaxID=1812349 RepID=A0A4Y8ABF2_9SPHI|nr:hypothetical protein [Mucilaginibacter phyllosphaerae]MBB3969367.1 hypothetical protein [Mucilaginibacter phyllosphaerae]TEW65845.1 hypothetical protein E2R65_11955 [Mucilaginibacter phyllosphaerae]GGH07979.1 hypothetical protein GCM10007352_12970 [Mucilaginibacter phyllosphaerae]
MLTPDQLIKNLSTNHTKGFIKQLSVTLRDQGFDIDRLIDLTFHPDKQVGFRAAWLLDTTLLSCPEYYVHNIPYLVKRMGDVTNQSCKRHYTRIMMHLAAPAAPQLVKEKLAVINLDIVIEKCFDWMIDPEVRVAVKVFAADTLYYLCHRHDWIKEELTNQVKFMMQSGGPAIQSRGRKLLALLLK